MTVRKVSISLPPEIYQAVVANSPGLPLSQAITDLLKSALGLTPREMFSMTDGKTTIPPELVDVIRAVVREEINTWQQEQNLVDIQPAPHIDKVEVSNEALKDGQVFGFHPEQWYTQAEVRDRLPSTINENTKKSKISKAMASGRLVSNGKKSYESRILGKSAIEWLTKVHQDNSIQHRG